jgi:hypothetical protein
MIIACLFGYEESSVPKLEVTGANEHAVTLAEVVALCSKAVKSEQGAVSDGLKTRDRLISRNATPRRGTARQEH